MPYGNVGWLARPVAGPCRCVCVSGTGCVLFADVLGGPLRCHVLMWLIFMETLLWWLLFVIVLGAHDIMCKPVC